MRRIKQWGWVASLAVGAALTLTACGGGNDALSSKATVRKVYVAGDSLADVGTFGGLKFTVVDPASPKNSQIWPQLIANLFGLDGVAQCSFYSITTTTTTNSACTNYAVGRARIVTNDSNAPPTIGLQLSTRGMSTYQSDDLLLVDGGGNDAADLVTAFLGALQGNTAGYQTFLLQQLDPGTLTSLMAQDSTGAAAATAYMQALANTHFNAIKTQALDKGAQHIGVLNIPDITLTPRFQAVLASLGAVQGPQIQALIRQWLSTFNNRLQALASGDSRLAVVDFYTDFQDEITHPASYSLSNVTAPACTTVQSVNFDKFPCLSTALDATNGQTPGWWKFYAFADDFHPTPYGHQLLASSVARALAKAGWL